MVWMRRRVLVIATYVVGCGSNSGAPKLVPRLPTASSPSTLRSTAVTRGELGLDIEAPGGATQGQEISLGCQWRRRDPADRPVVDARARRQRLRHGDGYLLNAA